MWTNKTNLPAVRKPDVVPMLPPGSTVESPTGSQAVIPIHGGIEFSTNPTAINRTAAWKLLTPVGQRRLAECAGGDVWGWGTNPVDDLPPGDTRPRAFMVGSEGMGILTPSFDAAGQPVYRISSFKFNADPSTRHRKNVVHRPDPNGQNAASSSASPVPAIAGISSLALAVVGNLPPRARSLIQAGLARRSTGLAPPAAEVPIHIAGLSSFARGVIGNLPKRAQELIQAPFVSERVIRFAWYIEGPRDTPDATVFMVVLAGTNHLTIASGSLEVPPGHTGADGHWQLECRAAEVESRSRDLP